MRINTNVASLTALNSNTETNTRLGTSLEKLSTGLKINKASDDASGLSIADKLRTQAASVGQGIQNANSASALINIADKAMSEQSNILDTVKTKLIQASTMTTSADGRAAVQADITKLLTQLDAIAEQTNYNKVNLLNSAQTFTFQTGEDSTYTINAQTATASNTAELGGTTGGVDLTGTDVAIASSVSMSQTTTGVGNAIVATFATGAEHKGDVISGNMDSLLFDDTATTFTANDAATTAILDSAVTAGLLTEAAGVYTSTISTIALNNQSISITLDTVADGAQITIATEQTISMTNASNTEVIDLANASTADNLNSLKVNGTLSATQAQSMMQIVDRSLTQLNTNRSEFGSTQNQIQSAVRSLQTTQVNLKAAESVIRDVDYAQESANFNKENIIAQAGTYAISQANNVQQNVMKLLQ